MDSVCYDQIAQNEEKHFWHKARRNILKKILTNQIPENADILDVGCGTGGNYSMLSAFGAVDGIEPDKDALIYFKEKNPKATVFKGALPNDIPAEINAKKYDLITAFDVLEHLPDDSTGLNVLINRLKDGGKILATVPACPFLFCEFDKILHHYRRYNQKQIVDLFEKNGLSVKFVNHFNFFLFPLVLCERIKIKLFKKYDFKNDYKITKSFLNGILYFVFSLERIFIKTIPFPIGSSLVIVGEKH